MESVLCWMLLVIADRLRLCLAITAVVRRVTRGSSTRPTRPQWRRSWR
jgi:hypothetical protein